MSNKFGTKQAQHLIDTLRVASKRDKTDVFKADFARVLEDAADSLEAAQRYFFAVESALI